MSTSDRVRVSPDGIQFFEPGMVHKATLRNYGAVDADTYLDLPTTSGTLATQEYVADNAGGSPTYIEGEGDPDTYSPAGFDVEIVGTATGGTYTLVINGDETAPIAYDHSDLETIVTDALGADVTVEVDLSFAPTASLYLAPANGYGTLTIAIGTSSLTGSGSPEATGTYYDWTDALQPSLAISSQYVNTLTGDVWLMSKDTTNQPVAVRKTWRQISGE